jgi:hypothetical protein
MIPITMYMSLFPLALITAVSSNSDRISSYSTVSTSTTIPKVTTTTVYNSSLADISNEKNSYNNHPIVSPNPVGKSGQINVYVNYTENVGIAKLSMDIEGPSLGLSDSNLTLPKIASLSLSLASGSPKYSVWTGMFTFPDALPDGNYLYSLVSTDITGNTKINGPFSGIILDRYPAEHKESQTRIISAVDGDNKNISRNGKTYSTDITFTFEGRDNTGVALFMQCNLDDTFVYSEHGEHGDVNTPLTTYSTCFVADEIARQVTGNHSYTDLGIGNHTFKVRLINNEYNVDGIPAVFNWRILDKT